MKPCCPVVPEHVLPDLLVARLPSAWHLLGGKLAVSNMAIAALAPVCLAREQVPHTVVVWLV